MQPSESEPNRPRLRLSVGAAVTVVLVLISIAVGFTLLRSSNEPMAVRAADTLDVGVSIEAGIYVHVHGEVRHPGLYILDTGARVIDAVAAAGGTTPDARLDAINLARPLSDGEQLAVPSHAASEGAQDPDDGLVSLNNADAAALERLPGIGPALAQRIIAWRQSHGGFATVDDLLQVSGIGPAVLAGLRDLVRL